MDMNKRPPLGLTPQFIWLEQRLQDIEEAIERRLEVRGFIPAEWITEYNELLSEVE